MEYYCCSYHHSMYCPECSGKVCWDRVTHHLNPEPGHIEENERRVVTKLNKGVKK